MPALERWGAGTPSRPLLPCRLLENKYLSTKIKAPPAPATAARGWARGPGAAGRHPSSSTPPSPQAAPKSALGVGLLSPCSRGQGGWGCRGVLALRPTPPHVSDPTLHPYFSPSFPCPTSDPPPPKKLLPGPFPPSPTPQPHPNRSPLPAWDPSAPSCPSQGSASPTPAWGHQPSQPRDGPPRVPKDPPCSSHPPQGLELPSPVLQGAAPVLPCVGTVAWATHAGGDSLCPPTWLHAGRMGGGMAPAPPWGPPCPPPPLILRGKWDGGGFAMP